ncbi:hypothetical protein Baya_16048 [Bagarius yarrelli]|uniref:Uncharacterized protein n=1 Tax=Bagarius yarrelli TaxID=175774 RepID=A0A556VU60_BAGYA|nr:hypothetical protein Baya_16048 [Bagarius yarrelli]
MRTGFRTGVCTDNQTKCVKSVPDPDLDGAPLRRQPLQPPPGQAPSQQLPVPAQQPQPQAEAPPPPYATLLLRFLLKWT